MIEKFKAWLQQNGAELLPTTNQFEAVRFKGREIGVMYTSGKFSNNYACVAHYCFQKGKKWEGKPINVGRKKTYVREKKALIIRDGSDCFYCRLPLEDDVTVEHLISLVSGGPNSLANMVLAHEECNHKMGNKLLVDKVKFAINSAINSQNDTNDGNY